MINKNTPDFTGKGIGLLLASLFFSEKAGELLKEDSSWYKYENKQLLNNLLLKNKPLLLKEKNLVNLLKDDAVIDKVKDVMNDDSILSEDIVENLSTEKNIFINFIYLFLTGDDNGLQNLDILLTALKDKIQLFTENDLFHILKDYSEQTTVVKHSDEYFKEFIKKYK